MTLIYSVIDERGDFKGFILYELDLRLLMRERGGGAL